MKIMKEHIKTLINKQMKYYPEANPIVLEFIFDFLFHSCKRNSEKDISFSDEVVQTMITQFSSGYCYYFAVMLQAAFQRGSICWAAPFGHIVWMDTNGIAYDIEGVNTSEVQYYIPISYIQEGLKDFKHVPGEEFNASEDYINNAILQYEKDNNLI